MRMKLGLQGGRRAVRAQGAWAGTTGAVCAPWGRRARQFHVPSAPTCRDTEVRSVPAP